MSFSINRRERTLVFLPADGIYPKYAIFVQNKSGGGSSRKHKCFSGGQKAVRKDLSGHIASSLRGGNSGVANAPLVS